MQMNVKYYVTFDHVEEYYVKLANPKSDFVNVNGIRLHYLDWGGSGPTLLFLTGMGSSAYIYNNFAPRFKDNFRVLALTRRGHGDSDYPDFGYDADTLVEDIRQFMDVLNIEKAILVGHSLAGVELTHFAGTFPERVSKLIYLDALDDRRKEHTINADNPLRNVKIKNEENAPPHTFEEYIANVKKNTPAFAAIWSELWEEEFRHGVKVNEEGIFVDKMPATIEEMLAQNLIKEYAPKQVETVIPILYIIGQRRPKLSNEYTEEQKAAYNQFHNIVIEPFFKSIIEDFGSRFPHAKIIVIPGGHHYCFIAQDDQVHEEMQKFLFDSLS